MPREHSESDDRASLLDQIKHISGRRIEDARRHRRLTQTQFARQAGLSVRWLREIESGSPSVKLDDHIECALALGIAPTYIFIPLICHVFGRPLPPTFDQADGAGCERLLVDLISAGRIDLAAGHEPARSRSAFDFSATALPIVSRDIESDASSDQNHTGPDHSGRQTLRSASRVASIEPITIRIPDAISLTGISRSTIYSLIGSGDIEAVKVGRSRYLVLASLKAYIARLPR